jgi:uncharacterized protein
MLFRRRKKADIWEQARIWLWPRRSFSRSINYIRKRVLRLSATPHAIAAGFAAGVFASFTPYLGFHMITAFAICYIVAGNLVSAAMGTFVGNPLTAPLIWGSTYETGYWVLKGSHPQGEVHNMLGKLLHGDFVALWDPLLKPMTVGAFLVGIPVSLLFYFAVRWATVEFQARRRERLAARAVSQAAKIRAKSGAAMVPGE